MQTATEHDLSRSPIPVDRSLVENAQIRPWRWRCHLFRCAVTAILSISIFASLAIAQNAATDQSPKPLPLDLNQYPGLLPEFGQLVGKLQRDIQWPTPRSQSRLLPLLPESTILYAAFPNYGDAAHQVLTTFQHEMEQSPVLREWWQHGGLAADGPKVEDALEKVHQLSTYLGDEIVVAGAMEDGKNPKLLVLAEVKKPGLKDFLLRTSKELSGTSKPPVRILDLQELATAKDSHTLGELLILVRPDFMVGAVDLATLSRFNARLDKGATELASTPFGQRVTQAYEGGATIVGAADVQQILKQIPAGQNQKTFDRTGFADAKYLVWEHKNVSGQAASQVELSFTGPRHGVASWLAAPGPMGGLDFVSPQAMMAGAVLLKNPAEIFDDISDLATASNPNALAVLAQMEQGLKLNLKGDLLSHLTGEITYEVDNFTPPNPVWKVILKVNDPDLLRAALTKLLAVAPVQAQQSEDQGITYHILDIPSGQKTTEIVYAFVEGYLVVASSRETLAEGIRLHRTSESLAKSEKFLASLPPGPSSEASALFYEDPVAVAAVGMRQVSPEIAAAFSQARSADSRPTVACAYGEESALRGASRSGNIDVGAVLVGAAIAIPNLLRARIAANEASAVATIRTVNTAQVTYASLYPQRGFATDLAKLGPDPDVFGKSSIDHANLMDATLTTASCIAGSWCEKSGLRFSVSAVCKARRCSEYVVVSTPVSSSTGTRSFCSTSDGVVRYKLGDPLASPVSAAECRTWSPLQ
jgi:hypothetical protein